MNVSLNMQPVVSRPVGRPAATNPFVRFQGDTQPGQPENQPRKPAGIRETLKATGLFLLHKVSEAGNWVYWNLPWMR